GCGGGASGRRGCARRWSTCGPWPGPGRASTGRTSPPSAAGPGADNFALEAELLGRADRAPGDRQSRLALRAALFGRQQERRLRRAGCRRRIRRKRPPLMRILVVNAGSSSLKLRVLGADDETVGEHDVEDWDGDPD